MEAHVHRFRSFRHDGSVDDAVRGGVVGVDVGGVGTVVGGGSGANHGRTASVLKTGRSQLDVGGPAFAVAFRLNQTTHPLVVGNAAPVQLPSDSRHPGRILVPHVHNNFAAWLVSSDAAGSFDGEALTALGALMAAPGCALRRLDLSRNPLGDAGVEALGEKVDIFSGDEADRRALRTDEEPTFDVVTEAALRKSHVHIDLTGGGSPRGQPGRPPSLRESLRGQVKTDSFGFARRFSR